ncbi:MAG: thiamine pyrophosphate-dependent enzyme, partial [Planctomycetales bacterium]
MTLSEALAPVRDARTDEIVVTTMGSAREWPKLSDHPLDFHYIPAAMSHAPAFALGLALAQPSRRVICFNGDGSLLMSLGGLVTIVGSGVKNFTMILLDNGVYEVTGGQKTPARGSPVDFVGLARSAGFASAASFHQADQWRQAAADRLAQPGPAFLHLTIEADHEAGAVPLPGPMP